MKHIRSLFPRILLLLSILFAGTAHSKERVNAVYSSISGLFLGCWVAQEAGYFDREGLQVNLIYIQGASTAIKAMMAGEAPVILAGGEAVIKSVFKGGGKLKSMTDPCRGIDLLTAANAR